MKDPHQDEMTQIYNKHAEKYFSQVADFEFPGSIFDIFLDELSGKKMLDIGCGFGRDIARLRKDGYEAYGIEISKNMISFAEEKIQKYITLWDITELHSYYDDESFDGIISSASLVHMDTTIGKEVLKKVYGLLKSSWVLFLSLKVASGEKKYLKTLFLYSLSREKICIL